MINWLARSKVAPIHMAPGDSIEVTYTDGLRKEVITSSPTKAIIVDTLAVGEFTDELGFKEGVVGVFGKE